MAHYDGADPGTPNRPAWLIFDSEYHRRYPLATLAPGEPLPPGLAASDDDLSALAATIGVDPMGLTATVKRFNTMCESGVDEDFGRGELPWSITNFGDPSVAPNALLGPITTPPFYAIKLTQVGMGIPSVGLETDTHGRVKSVRGNPIKGLYAAGNAAARTDVPGYQSGIANARGLALGYRAALDAVAATTATA
jgi:3-oxosteroid 1-dehydrogenase